MANEPKFKENLGKDIKMGIDECIIEVEAKSAKGILRIFIFGIHTTISVL